MIIENNQDLILVVGSTGDLGGTITRMLLAKGKNVRILVRPQSNYQPLVAAGAQKVFGDLKDPASLNAAVKGAKFLITTATATKRGGQDTPTTVDLEGNHNLIDAAKGAGVKQFIFTSLSIADPNSPVPFVQAKAKTEDYLRAGKIPFTIVAPNAFMETWIALPVGIPAVTGQNVTIVGEGKRKHSFISLNDVAKFMVASVNNPKAINQRIVIGGPKPYSMLDSVAVFEKVLNRQIPVNHVAPGELVPGWPTLISEMLAGLNFFDSPIEMEELSKRYGVELTSMEDFAKKFIEKFKVAK
jgi:NADH dehydrogenase